MSTEHDSARPAEDSPAIRELRARLEQVRAELRMLQDQRAQLDGAIETRQREAEALSVSIQSLGGRDAPETSGRQSVEVQYRGGDRPTIRIIAREQAQHAGGTLRVRDLLRETRKLGFKSDQGGLHTYLKGLQEFIQSGPGEFSLLILDSDEDVDPGQTADRSGAP
jgi:hypothetical protein